MTYEAYRTLSCGTLEGRVMEEVVKLRKQDALLEGQGAWQDGKGDSLISSLIDTETRNICRAQQRQCGDYYGDEQEAHDRQDRNEALHAIANRCGTVDRIFCVMHDMLHLSMVVIDEGGHKSKPYAPAVGLEEGRLLSTDIVNVAQANKLERINAAEGVGVGLNPPAEALHAYWRHTDHSDAEYLDVKEVRQMLSIATREPSGWDLAMAHASSDAIRCAMLDYVSTVVFGARSFADDLKVKVGSRAQSAHTKGRFDLARRKQPSISLGVVMIDPSAQSALCRTISAWAWNAEEVSQGSANYRRSVARRIRSVSSN